MFIIESLKTFKRKCLPKHFKLKDLSRIPIGGSESMETLETKRRLMFAQFRQAKLVYSFASQVIVSIFSSRSLKNTR